MYALDKTTSEAARKSDAGIGSIKEIGKYIGEFTQAKDLTSKDKGTKGIEFQFKSQAGQKANLSIWIQSAEGERYQGFDALMAIMACMGLRNITPKVGNAIRYDYDTKEDVTEQASIFPELCKPIGVLLETEDYTKKDGSTGTRMVLKNVFQAGTELTASEILDRKTQPEQLAKMVQGLRHRPLRGAKAPAQRTQHDYPDAQESDEIPF